MPKLHYYQMVMEYGKYDIEYTIYEARKDEKNNIEIAAIPFVLVGNRPKDILDTLKAIESDIRKHPAVDKVDCNIFHDKLWHEDENEYFHVED